MKEGHPKSLRARSVSGSRLVMLTALVLMGGGSACGGSDNCDPGSSASCGGNHECGSGAGGTCELRGYVVVGNEVWAFQHCGSDVLISVDVQGNEPGFDTLDDALHESMGCTELATGTWSCLRESAAAYVEMTATISAPGRYGHFGKYERELEMVQIHRASSVGPAECARLDPILP